VMDCRFLETALEQACDPGLVFQVLSQETYLYVYINRDGDVAVDFDDLTQRVRGAIVAERLKEIRWLCLYSRPFGTDDPDWELVLELQPPTLVLDPLPPRTQSRSASMAARTVRQTDTTVLLHDETDVFDQANMEAPAPSIDDVDLNWSSPSDGGSSLPSTLGLDATAAPPSKSPSTQDLSTFLQLPEEEDADLADLPIVTVPAVDRPMVDRDPKDADPKAVESNAADPEPADPKVVEAKAADPKVAEAKQAIGDYCFVRNPMLLTSDIQPPSGHLSQLLMAFHALGESAQMELLPHFSDWFRQKGFPQELPWSPLQRAWIDGSALEGNDQRRAPIWFSRYCYDPAATAQAIERLQRPKAEADEPEAPQGQAESDAPQRAEQKQVETNRPVVAIGGFAESLVEKVEPYQPKFPAWAPLVALGVASFVAIVSTFFASSSFAGSSDVVCKLSKSPKYCKLAVEMVGSEPISKAKDSGKFLTNTEKEYASFACYRQAEGLYGSEPFKVEVKDVAKGLVLTDMMVKNERPGAKTPTVRVACLATAVEGKAVPLRVATIPENWPKEPYQDESGLSAMSKFAHIQRNPIVRISTVFVFTTAGLFLAAILNLGIRIYSMEAVVLTALSLGILETIVFSLVPIGGIPAVMAVDMLLLFGLTFKIKGLNLELSSGYQMISMGIGVMLGVRQLLTWLLILSATAIVH
jgi:hypothetical protein